MAALHLYTCSCSHQAHAVQHNTTNTCGHAQSVIGPECSNDLKGSGLCIIAFRHLLRSARVLNNTEVKGHYSTICRHACFGVLRLISAAWYTSTYVAALHLYTCSCSHQAHAVQHNTTNTCGHAQSVIGPECSNDLKGSGLCIIAFRHLLRSARVLNNTEVKGHYIYIYIYIYLSRLPNNITNVISWEILSFEGYLGHFCTTGCIKKMSRIQNRF